MFVPFYLEGDIIDSVDTWHTVVSLKTYKEAIRIFDESCLGNMLGGIPNFSLMHQQGVTLREWARANGSNYVLLQEITVSSKP